MDQQQAWNQEYSIAQGIPTSTRTTPSSAVKRLLEYIKKHRLETGKKTIDLGCGIGRNTLYLVEQGYRVTAVDFAESALEKFHHTLEKSPYSDRVTLKQIDLAKPLPFADDSFDIAIDIVTTMSLTPQEIVGLEAELRRIMRPDGLFLTYVLSDDDGFLAATAPSQTTTTIKKTGITDNYFSEKRLRELYKHWHVLELAKVEKIDFFYGKNYTRRIWWVLLRNING